MGRIRTIKPEFPQSESMGRVSRESRLCFILLFTLADDSGRLRGNSRMLASLLYPYDDDAKKHIDTWLSELHREKCIERYEIDGDSYVQLNNWLNHQKIDKPTASKIPPPPDIREDSRGLADDSRKIALDQGMDQGKERIKEARDAPPDGVSLSVWQDFLKLRKTKKAPVTDTAIAGIRREALKAGMGLSEALATCCQRGWTGFKADWVAQPGLAVTVTKPDVPDPALEKLERDRKLAAPMPESVRKEFERLRVKV